MCQNLTRNVVVNNGDVDAAVAGDLLVGVDVEPALIVAREVDELTFRARLGHGMNQQCISHHMLSFEGERAGVFGELVPH